MNNDVSNLWPGPQEATVTATNAAGQQVSVTGNRPVSDRPDPGRGIPALGATPDSQKRENEIRRQDWKIQDRLRRREEARKKAEQQKAEAEKKKEDEG